jgi:hypothetical protein
MSEVTLNPTASVKDGRKSNIESNIAQTPIAK